MVIHFPERFSFIEEPDQAIEILETLVAASLHHATKRIYIQQDRCSLIDLCAEAAASALAIDACNHCRVSFGGQFPESSEQREIVIATGMPRNLGISLPEPPGFLRFALHKGRRSNRERATISSEREKAATNLTEYVNRCLKEVGYSLSTRGAKYLADIVGEVINNAEEHSGLAEWWIAGYLRRRDDREYGDCHVTIFNFGHTIHESLLTLPKASQLRQDIEELVRIHAKAGYFQRSRWSEEGLWTLYALQEGVSRHNTESDRIGDRGIGTADMIDFFQRLGRTQSPDRSPKMSVVSGQTHIVFDDRYRLAPQTTESGEKRRIIAFNDDNDFRKPPSDQHVRRLERRFPGTLISLRFYIDQEHLRSVVAKDKDEGRHD